MHDIEAPAIVYVNANEKDKDDNSSSNGDWSHKAGGSQGPADLVQRRLKQRHIQMWVLCSTLRFDPESQDLMVHGVGLLLPGRLVLVSS